MTRALFVAVIGVVLAGAVRAQPPSSAQPAAAPAGDADRGKTLFTRNGCYQCHNYEGQGGAAGPRIAPNPLPFRGFAAYVRAPRGDMPPYTVKVMAEQDLADVYAYLRTRARPRDVSTNPLLSR